MGHLYTKPLLTGGLVSKDLVSREDLCGLGSQFQIDATCLFKCSFIQGEGASRLLGAFPNSEYSIQHSISVKVADHYEWRPGTQHLCFGLCEARVNLPPVQRGSQVTCFLPGLALPELGLATDLSSLRLRAAAVGPQPGRVACRGAVS